MSPETFDNLMSKRTIALLRRKGVHVVINKPVVKTSKIKAKKDIKMVTMKNNLLEYYVFVMDFVRNKYGISEHLLKQLFYLYPKKIFCRQDFYDIPFKVPYNFQRLIREGLIEEYLKISNKQLYQLSPNAKNAVERFHHYLVDPTKMPVATMLATKEKVKGKIAPLKLDALIKKLKKVS